MEYRVKKYNGMSPGTFYAITDNETRDSGYINFPLWIVNLDTGIITEIEKGKTFFMPGWEGEVEYKILVGRNMMFTVDTRDDMFTDNFKNVPPENIRKGLYQFKGRNILYLNQRSAVLKAREILLRKQQKINEELDMINSLISY
jgi:hypothetical protein